jgi:hypothetical protein
VNIIEMKRVQGSCLVASSASRLAASLQTFSVA